MAGDVALSTPAASAQERLAGLRALGCVCLDSHAAYLQWRSAEEGKLAARWRIAQQLRDAQEGSHLCGWCGLCERLVRFGIKDAPHLGTVWDFRDDAVCEGCAMMARLRLGALVTRQLLAGTRPRIYINEQVSPLYSWLLRQYRDVVGSEYAPDPATHDLQQRRLDWVLRGIGRRQRWLWRLRGESPQRLLHQDATALTFADRRFSAVLSFEVLEHVPDYPRALRECARVLEPGGWLVMTAPFLEDRYQTRVRAVQRLDGSVDHLLPPDYHGDPMATGGNGILCYQDFGWDILDSLRAAGFRGAWTLFAWNPLQGIPTTMPIWVAQR